MQKKDLERIRKNPLLEAKKRFNAFYKEVDKENVSEHVASYGVNDSHEISVEGRSKNYAINITISKRI